MDFWFTTLGAAVMLGGCGILALIIYGIVKLALYVDRKWFSSLLIAVGCLIFIFTWGWIFSL